MSTTLTGVIKKPCAVCLLPHPEADGASCEDCSRAIASGKLSGQMLNQLWYEKLPEMAARLQKSRHLSNIQLKGLEHFRQSMHRSVTPHEIDGKLGEMTNAKWAEITEKKLQLHRHHQDPRLPEVCPEVYIAINALIANVRSC